MSEDEEDVKTIFSIFKDWQIDTLKALVSSPTAWVVSTIIGVSVTQAQEDLRTNSAVELIVEKYLWEQIMFPIASDIWYGLFNFLESIITVLFGSNGTVGVEDGGTWGIVDIPIQSGVLVGRGIWESGLSTYSALSTANQAIAASVEPFGLAAPIVVAVVWAFELGVVSWVAWAIISSIDIPGVRVVQAFKSITKPLRNIMGMFK